MAPLVLRDFRRFAGGPVRGHALDDQRRGDLRAQLVDQDRPQDGEPEAGGVVPYGLGYPGRLPVRQPGARLTAQCWPE